MNLPLLLTQSQAASYLGISRDVLREEIADQNILVVAVRDSVRVPRAECERYASALIEAGEARRCRSAQDETGRERGSSTSESAGNVTGKRSGRKPAEKRRPWNGGSSSKLKTEPSANVVALPSPTSAPDTGKNTAST